MNKILGGFAAGQLLQILILYVALQLTYSANTLVFCMIIGGIATLMLCIGSGLTSIEMTTPADTDMEEAEPISKHLKVTNTNVERVPEKKRRSLGEQIAEAYDKFNAIDETEKAEAKAVMETKLERVGADV